jgi:hypothetical protein
MGDGNRYVKLSLAKIEALENRLSGTLKPVTPRKEFINRLGQNMNTRYRPTFVNYAANWHIYAMITAALVSMAVVLAVIVRVLVETAGRRRTA